jgi:hypothetical protein
VANPDLSALIARPSMRFHSRMATRVESRGGRKRRLELPASGRALSFAWPEREAVPLSIGALYGIDPRLAVLLRRGRATT